MLFSFSKSLYILQLYISVLFRFRFN